MKCRATKSDGTKCKTWAMHNSQYCFRHNKKLREQALQASSDGGKAKRQYHCLGRRMKLQTPEDIKRFMAKAINKLWTGKMPANNPAGSLGYLAKIFLDAYNQSELESRLEKLEEKIEQAKL